MIDKIIRSAEVTIVGILFSKLLSERNIKKVANQVGENIDTSLDKRYLRRSEKLQARLITKIHLFSDCLCQKLSEDWETKEK